MTDYIINNQEFRIRKGIVRLLSLREALLDTLVDPEDVARACREQGVPADILSFSQHLPDLTPKYDYYMEWGNIAAVPITTYDEWYNSQIHRNARKKIRKAQKSGVRVEVRNLDSDVIAGIAGIFNETPIRRGKRYPHFGMSAEEAEKELSPDLDRSVFLVASFEGETIGFIKLLYCRDYARASGTVAKISHRDKGTMNALLARAVQLCAEKKIAYLIYGKYSYGKEQEGGLIEFKRHNGFQRIRVPEYYVPLTIRGKIGLLLGVHHGVAALLPRGLAKLLKRIRSLYHEKRVHPGRRN